MLLHHVIMTSYCCQRYAESLVTTLCSSRTVRQCTSTPRRARATVELQRLETPNFLALNLRPPNSPDLCPVDYNIWAVMQHSVNHRQIHSVDKTTLCSSRTVRQCTSTPRRVRTTVELQRLETPNFLAPNLRPPNSPDFCPVDYEIWAIMQHRVNHT